MGTGNILLGYSDGYATLPGRSGITPSRLMLQKPRLSPARSGKPHGSYADLTPYLLQVERQIMANSRSLNYFGQEN